MAAFLKLPDGERVRAEDGMIVGRDTDAGIVVHDARASRRHAQLIVRRGMFEIEDLGSANGTLLNGSRVTRRALHDGDVIMIGGTAIGFVSVANGTEDMVEDLFAGDDASLPRQIESVELIRRAPAHSLTTTHMTPVSFTTAGLSRRARVLLVLLALIAVAGLVYLITL